MVIKISEEKATVIIDLYLSGLDERKIAKRVGVAQSTVVGCISRFCNELETMPEFTMKKYHVEDKIEKLRLLAVELKKNKITAEEARKGVKVRNQMEEQGVKDSDIPKVLSIIRKEGLVPTAMKLMALENKGKKYEDVLNEHKEKSCKIEAQEKEIKENAAALKNLKIKKADVIRKLQEEQKRHDAVLHKNKIGEAKLYMIASLIERKLSQKNLTKDEITQMIDDISKIGGLKQYLKQKKKEQQEVEISVNNLTLKENSIAQNVSNLASRALAYDNSINAKTIRLNSINKNIQAAETRIAKLSSAIEKKKGVIETVNVVSAFLASKDVYAFEIDDVIKEMQVAKQAKAAGYNATYELYTNKARKRLSKLLFPLVQDQYAYKWQLDSQQQKLQKLDRDLAENYIAKTAYEQLKLYFTDMEKHRQENAEMLRKIKETSEACRKQYDESLAKKDEEIKKEQSEKIKEREEKLKIISELDKAYKQLKSMENVALWQKANINPEQLSYTELHQLIELLKNIMLKKLPATALKYFFDRRMKKQ